MSSSVQFGTALLIIYGIFASILSMMSPFPREARDFLAVAAFAAIAGILALRMNGLRHQPEKEFRLHFMGHRGENLTEKERHHLFWTYLITAFLFSVGVFLTALRLFLR